MLYRVSEDEVMDTLDLLRGIPHRNAFGETVILDREMCSTLIQVIEELRDIEESEQIHMEEIHQLENEIIKLKESIRKVKTSLAELDKHL